jgi:hypothetical protein
MWDDFILHFLKFMKIFVILKLYYVFENYPCWYRRYMIKITICPFFSHWSLSYSQIFYYYSQCFMNSLIHLLIDILTLALDHGLKVDINLAHSWALYTSSRFIFHDFWKYLVTFIAHEWTTENHSNAPAFWSSSVLEKANKKILSYPIPVIYPRVTKRHSSGFWDEKPLEVWQ